MRLTETEHHAVLVDARRAGLTVPDYVRERLELDRVVVEEAAPDPSPAAPSKVPRIVPDGNPPSALVDKNYARTVKREEARGHGPVEARRRARIVVGIDKEER